MDNAEHAGAGIVNQDGLFCEGQEALPLGEALDEAVALHESRVCPSQRQRHWEAENARWLAREAQRKRDEVMRLYGAARAAIRVPEQLTMGEGLDDYPA